MTYSILLIVWLLLIAANLYMAKTNTDSFYMLMARKKYDEARSARILVVCNLVLAALISALAVWASF